MRKLILLIGMSIAISASMLAAPVTKKKALREAVGFVQQKNASTAESSMSLVAQGQPTAQGQPSYYIFNIGQDGGFVVISGDDRTNPILGYSNTGSIDPSRMPANMKAWLDGYDRQMGELATMSDAQAEAVMSAPRKAKVTTRNSIAPMITTQWDQATPYWNECPQFMNSDNEADGYELAYTGCVATSMSQLMYFHKYPEQTTNVIPAYTFTYSDGNYNYSTVEMDELPTTTFDWAHMRETYTGAEDEVYTSAVAHLMFYVGCALKTQYGVSSSGAYTDDIPKAFALFGYGSKIAFRNDYTQADWDNLVYEELKAGRPMIYNGTAGSGGGHSFICDGFEYGDYFHINWGWGGMGNGFFQLSILNPRASGIGGSSSSEGYNMKQNIIYNIIPGTAPTPGSGDEEETEPVLTATNVSGPSGWDRDRLSAPFKIYKSKIVKASYSDHDGSGKKFKEALALYDPSNDTYTVLTNSETNIYMTVTTSALGQTYQFGSGIASNASNVIKFGAGLTGTYRLVPMYQVEGSSEWKPMKETDRYYLEVNMSNTYCTTTTHPMIDLSVTNWEFVGEKKVGSKMQINATIKNSSPDRYFGDIYLDFGGQQLDEYSQYTTVVQAEVLAGEEKVVTFNVSPATAGTKTVRAMLVDSYGSFYNLASAGSVTIAESETADLDLSVEIEATNAEGATTENTHGTIYDSRAQFKATIKNNSTGEYNKYVLAPLFICQWDAEKDKYTGSMVTYKQQQLSLAAGEEKTLYFDFDNLAYGSVYSMNIYARNNVPDSEEASHVDNIVKPGESKYYAIERGIITWKGDGTRQGYKPAEGFAIPDDAAAVSLEGLSIATVGANDNPNTLYFLSTGQETPAGLEGKNIISGNQAGNIALEDGYDFFTPQTFTAQNISYTRTFTEGHNNSVSTGWSTIVLPFAPATVANKTDRDTIDWFRSADDSGKQFWLCDFAEEDGTDVYFRNAPEMLANVPYIVAVPDNKWGAKWDLRGKEIEWSATNSTIKPGAIAYTSGQNMFFAGTYAKSTLEEILALNTDGSHFTAGANPTVEAFHAYFDYINAPATAAEQVMIRIIGGETDGIRLTEVSASKNEENAVYDLQGRRLKTENSNLSTLPKGVYIVGGKKIVKR
ncbi:MAG: thiol protease/hemagglutinin PrtT [Prevotella sp.]|nr:thiol protease/hemagglutinin PrtT [Prevotella sp.]